MERSIEELTREAEVLKGKVRSLQLNAERVHEDVKALALAVRFLGKAVASAADGRAQQL